MRKRFFTFLALLIGGTLFLTPEFHNDPWNVVEEEYYRVWQRTYERVVVARLAKSQQDGIFSAGGLLGLANSPNGWNFDTALQYEIYNTGAKVEDYLPYKSHPGFQGALFSALDRITNFSPSQNIWGFRVIVSLLSALTVSLFAAVIAVEFGWLAGILILAFSSFSEWMVLPGGNLYWNLWAFYLPFLAGIFLPANYVKGDNRCELKIYAVMFMATLAKVLFTGFEMITTTIVMATVPFVYHAIINKWRWKIFAARIFKLGVAMLLATLSGLLILSFQIAINDGSLKSSLRHISGTVERRMIGEPDDYKGSNAAIVWIYLNINAFNTKTAPSLWQRPYWQIVALFACFTLIFLARHRASFRTNPASKKGLALTIVTWYSILAPLSWIIIFKPTAYIHIFLFPMAWQMPFTLLGFALCGYVITDLFKRKTA